MNGRVLIAARLDRSASVIATLNGSIPLFVDTTSDVSEAIQRLSIHPYELVIVDLELRAAFLLLDAIQAMDAPQRPFVIVLRGTSPTHAAVDPEVVTAVLSPNADEDFSSMLIGTLATCRSVTRKPPRDTSERRKRARITR